MIVIAKVPHLLLITSRVLFKGPIRAVGSLAVYAVETLLMNRARSWNYRRISLAD